MNPKSFIPLIFFALCLACPLAHADSVPKLINYQGKLTDAVGGELNGEYQLEFRLFDAATGGSLVWGEKRIVTVVNGVFNVALGGAGAQPVAGAAVNDIGFAFGDANRFLETRILSGPGIVAQQILSPRQQMVSVPFAVAAQDAAQAVNSENLAGNAPEFWVPPGMISAYGGTGDPAGWLICDGRAVSRTQYPRLFEAIGTTYGAGNGSTTFNLPNAQGLVLRGTGTRTVNGRSKVGPTLGAVQEDQMQRITGYFDVRRHSGGGATISNDSGALSVGAGSGTAGNTGTSASSDSTRQRASLDSGNSPNARTSSTTDGETRVSSLGVNYIIKY